MIQVSVRAAMLKKPLILRMNRRLGVEHKAGRGGSSRVEVVAVTFLLLAFCQQAPAHTIVENYTECCDLRLEHCFARPGHPVDECAKGHKITGLDCDTLCCLRNILDPSACPAVETGFCSPDLDLDDGDDTDGDGLSDAVEVCGYLESGIGYSRHTDLADLGADPLRKDLFVEVDCLVSDGNGDGDLRDPVDHSHCPPEDAIRTVVQAFANAPVDNPDGTTGIQLHVDLGGLYSSGGPFGTGRRVRVFGSRGVVGNYGELRDSVADLGSFGFVGGGDRIPEAGNEIIDCEAPVDVGAVSLYALKADHFSPRRAPVFRYALFAHQVNCRRPLHDCTGGWAESIGCNDFVVSKGGRSDRDGDGVTERPCWTSTPPNGLDDDGDGLVDEDPPDDDGDGLENEDRPDGIDNDGDGLVDEDGFYDHDGDGLSGEDGGFSVGSSSELAATFMHELGHCLGLRHGGGDNVNDKPNYLSTMNYAFSGGCNVPASPAAVDLFPGGCTFSALALPFPGGELDETNVDECVGVDGRFLGFGQVDWDDDGRYEGVSNCDPPNHTNIVADLNEDGVCVSPGPDGVLDTMPASDDIVDDDQILDGTNGGANNLTCDSVAVNDDEQGDGGDLVRAVGDMQPAPLEGFDDWGNLIYDFKSLPTFADGVAAPLPDEPDPEVIERAVRKMSQRMEPVLLVEASAPQSASSGDVLTFTVQMRNEGRGPALNVAVSDVLPDGSQAEVEIGTVPAAEVAIATFDHTVAGGSCAGELSNRTTVRYRDIVGVVKVASATTHVTLIDTAAPDVSCPSDVVVECAAHGGTPVSDPGIAAFLADATATDDCDPSPELSNDAPGTFAVGETRVTFTATDASGNSSSCIARVTVRDTVAPTVSCPLDVTAECSTPGGIPLVDPALQRFLSAFSTQDVCDADPEIVHDAPEFVRLGTARVTFTATDATGNAARCSALLTVEDTTPPSLSLRLAPTVLWPPRHQLVDVKATVELQDACDSMVSFTLDSITSDEPQQIAGSGKTGPDVVGADIGSSDLAFSLRAERSGRGEQRIYTVEYTATDAAGLTATATGQITVPRDRRNRGPR